MSSAQPQNLFLPYATATELTAADPRARELVYNTTTGAVHLGIASGQTVLADAAFVGSAVGAATTKAALLGTLGPIVYAGNEINVLDYGAVANYSTDNYTAFTAAIAVAKVRSVGVYIPAGNYALYSQVNWFDVPFRGAGEALTLIYTPSFNGSLFKITADGDMSHRTYGSMTFVNSIPSGTDYTASAAIEIAGDSNGYALYNRFFNMTFLGFRDAIKITKGTHGTSFGLESLFSKNTFSGLVANNNTNPGKNLIRFTKGSGTANVFNNLSGDAGLGDPDSAYLYYDGGYVVGDITFGTSQLTGAASAVYIGAGAVYKSNITFPGTQIDSNTVNLIKCADATVNLRSIHTAGTNTGGGASFGLSLGSRVEQSVIHDLGADQYLVGNEKGSSTGTNVTTLFAVDVAANTAAEVEIRVFGLALGGAWHKETFTLNAAQGAKSQSKSFMTAAGVITGTSPVTVTSALAGSVITFTATFTGSGLGNVEAQLTKQGGAARITRIP